MCGAAREVMGDAAPLLSWPPGHPPRITSPDAVYVVRLPDVFDGCNCLTCDWWGNPSRAVPHLWDAEIEGALGSDRLKALRALVAQKTDRDGNATPDGKDAGFGGDAPQHAYLDHILYEAIIKQRVPGVRALGNGIVFSVPGASSAVPAEARDVLRLIRNVFLILGNEDHPSRVRLHHVPAELVAFTEAITRDGTDLAGIQAAWDALDPTAQTCLRTGVPSDGVTRVPEDDIRDFLRKAVMNECWVGLAGALGMEARTQ